EMFKPNPFSLKLIYAAGYTFLTIISIGFGFGFYWKVLESRGESTRSAESAVTQVQGSLTAASARLDQLQQTLDQLTTVSLAKAQSERATGNSCPASKPGDGPRRKLREEDASRFSFASDFVKGRATSVKTEMAGLDGDLVKIASADKSTIDASGTRNAFMQGVSRKLDQTVTSFNAFRTDPQLRQIRGDLAERAEKTTFPDGAGKAFSCPDGQLQTALRGVVRAIDGLPELEKPKIAAVEGSEATIEAFRRLVASFSGLLQFKLPPSADELRELQKKAIQSVESPATAAAAARMNEQPGLSKRDYVPLAIAVFVDLCLLLVAMGRNHDRLSGLVPKMRAAERGPVIQILSRFNEIHRDRQVRENFELFRHVVFDFHGDYYVAVPLDAPKRMNPHEREDLRLEAQLLSNLFASFEKERIFSRVYSPLLTTGAVRKRLARQGSKFAGSEAFRLYRFKDGAWSDIILGAVMGAARRVEGEKRTLALKAEEIARNAPLPDPAYDRPYPVADAATSRSKSFRTARTNRSFDTGYTAVGPTDGDHDLARRYGSYASFAARAEPPPSYTAAFHEHESRPYDETSRPSRVPRDNVQPHYPSPHGRDFRSANSNTAPMRNRDPAKAAAPQPAAPVVGSQLGDVVPFVPQAQPRGQTPGPANAQALAGYGFAAAAVASAAISSPAYAEPVLDAPAPYVTVAEVAPVAVTPLAPTGADAEPMIDVASGGDWQRQLGIVMTRVTESITVPVSSEAQLPGALLAAGIVRSGHAVEPVPMSKSVDLAAQPEHLTLAVEAPTYPGDWSETDTALAKRYVRGAAE
ncbi:MAG: hypothetical protein K2Y05_05625, partial [Hyphomicrobiaceae bacterium]|nr:hypothetical protein [Hyphomicrobiaceae bacterium]